MKRKLAIMLTGCMLLYTLAGCGSTGQISDVSITSGSELTKLVVAARGGSHVDVINSVKEKFEQENK